MIGRLWTATLAIICAVAVAPALAAQNGQCADLAPGSTPQIGASRPIRAEDLIRLRDIGWSGMEDAPLALSADGTRVAFQVRRANPATNSYCFGMFVLSLGKQSAAHLVDSGGEFMFWPYEAKSSPAERAAGIPADIVPKWSPDGNRIAYLRRDHGVTQLWQTEAKGGRAQPVTHSDIDVRDFAWLPDGRGLVMLTRPGLKRAAEQIEAEGKSGFRYDDRYFPMASSRPLPKDKTDGAYDVVDASSLAIRPATSIERAVMLPKPSPLPPTLTPLSASGTGGRLAWIVPADEQRPYLAQVLVTSLRGGPVKRCAQPECTGHFVSLWSANDGKSLIFLKRFGEANSQYALFRWTPTQDKLTRIFTTDDLLTGCENTGVRLICLDEASTRPRRVVAIDLRHPKTETLFDPNPEFAAIHLGNVRKMVWRNAMGLETFGNLVLPPDYQAGSKLPLVVVQYESRGFLRGGTGDEYPIQLFASAGFAVLSIQRPLDIGLFSPAKTGPEIYRADLKDFADRRSTLSSVETAVKMLIDEGIVDPKRVGLTGLSDGASTVHFALMHSHMFAVVSMSSCCEDEGSLAPVGPAAIAYFQSAGAPAPGDRNDAYWDQYSLARSAARIDTPILIQMADREALESYLPVDALRLNGKPVDAYIFPDEYHIKWQPAHRLAAYQRNVDWFEFWLMGTTCAQSSETCDAWQAMRRALAHAASER